METELQTQEIAIQTHQPLMFLDGRPQKTLEQIYQAGNVSGVAFAEQVPDFPQMRALEPQGVRTALGAIIVQHATLIGFKGLIDPIQKEDIIKLIQSRFFTLSIEEIYKALQMERYREFDTCTEHYQLINAPYICEILEKYKEWLRNTRQTHHLSNSLPSPKEEELSEEEKEAKFIANIQHFYNDFKQNKRMPLFCGYLYDGLKRRGMIADFTDEEKELLTKRYKQRKANERDNKSLVSRLKKSFESVDDDISLKKEIALEYIFENDKLLITDKANENN